MGGNPLGSKSEDHVSSSGTAGVFIIIVLLSLTAAMILLCCTYHLCCKVGRNSYCLTWTGPVIDCPTINNNNISPNLSAVRSLSEEQVRVKHCGVPELSHDSQNNAQAVELNLTGMAAACSHYLRNINPEDNININKEEAEKNEPEEISSYNNKQTIYPSLYTVSGEAPTQHPTPIIQRQIQPVEPYNETCDTCNSHCSAPSEMTQNQTQIAESSTPYSYPTQPTQTLTPNSAFGSTANSPSNVAYINPPQSDEQTLSTESTIPVYTRPSTIPMLPSHAQRVIGRIYDLPSAMKPRIVTLPARNGSSLTVPITHLQRGVCDFSTPCPASLTSTAPHSSLSGNYCQASKPTIPANYSPLTNSSALNSAIPVKYSQVSYSNLPILYPITPASNRRVVDSSVPYYDPVTYSSVTNSIMPARYREVPYSYLPIPNTPTTNHEVSDCQTPNYRQEYGSMMHEVPQATLCPNYDEECNSTVPQNYGEAPNSTNSENNSFCNSKSARKISSQKLQTPSLPNLAVPSTSSAPFPTAEEYALGNASRFIYYRNSNIDVQDLQGSNLQIYQSREPSNDSLLSLESSTTQRSHYLNYRDDLERHSDDSGFNY